MHGILFDHARNARIGLPEAVFCEGKSFDALLSLLEGPGLDPEKPILFTRLAPEVFQAVPEQIRSRYQYHALARTAFAATLPERLPTLITREAAATVNAENTGCSGKAEGTGCTGKVAVVSAGTADGPVTWEAAKTLEYLGIRHSVYEDNGVAGLWRLTSNLEQLAAYDVLIVVAGLDAALASVLGGLTPRPIFAVPTSVGYGLARRGETALASMLVSCAPGVSVLNIDNGYGAACAAARVMNLLCR
ncbi:MAG: nickel pincer cofactor biosynthesis protein LarB [Deltaproteobacteria bacterium]|nr:nickel pincer cofactor biosynthesis protein LarB [Deltaproteobacteria bacterium]